VAGGNAGSTKRTRSDESRRDIEADFSFQVVDDKERAEQSAHKPSQVSDEGAAET
jgi:hypothetical protein